MARQYPVLLIAAGVMAVALCTGIAQEPAPTPSPSPSPSPAPSPQAAFVPPSNKPVPVIKKSPAVPPITNPEEANEIRKMFDRLPPGERERFRDNYKRWKEMTPVEKQAMSDREKLRREKAAREIDDAIQKSGLQLNKEKHDAYARRYAQERRKIEEDLRKEMDVKRGPLIGDMIERLKTEFNASPEPSPSPVPPVSAPVSKVD